MLKKQNNLNVIKQTPFLTNIRITRQVENSRTILNFGYEFLSRSMHLLTRLFTSI